MRSCGTGLAVVVAALQRGDALCASDLRAVLQRLGELQPWSEAAKSDNSLRTTLKQLGGQQATIELRQLLEDVAADDEQDKEDINSSACADQEPHFVSRLMSESTLSDRTGVK